METYKGKQLTEYTKEELIEIIKELVEDYEELVEALIEESNLD